MDFKKFMVLFLCILLFASCSDNNVVKEPEPVEEPEVIEEDNIPTAWNLSMEEFRVDVPFSVPDVIPVSYTHLQGF